MGVCDHCTNIQRHVFRGNLTLHKQNCLYKFGDKVLLLVGYFIKMIASWVTIVLDDVVKAKSGS